MSVFVRRSRGLFIALVALAISAGLAFAARSLPDASHHGMATASEASGKTVPVGHDHVAAGQGDEPAAAGEPAVEGPAGNPVATGTNHGALVSEAAHMTTPDGFRNHGEFVSCVAHMPHDKTSAGSETASTPIDLTTLTPEDCRAAREAAREAKEAARDARAEERAAAKVERKAAMAERRSTRGHGNR